MRHSLLWVIAPIILLTACSNGTTFSVKGKFSNKLSDGKIVLLQKIDAKTGTTKILDSTQVKGDAFEFKGEAKEETNFNVIVPKTPDGQIPSITFVREPGNIEVQIKDIQNYTISGTKTNEQFQKMQSRVLELQKKSGLEGTQQQELIKQMVAIIYEYVNENIQNSTGEQLFGMIASQLDSKQIEELLKNARPAFKEKKEVKMLQTIISSKHKMATDNQYQDVELVDTNGTKVSLSTYIGKSKFILIDFWASWCPPCIREMPNVVAAYSKFKSKGFEIVGISIDKDKESWLKAIKEKNMTWIQLNDVDGIASQIYGVESIPHTILIDEKGKIVAKNLRGKELESKLEELFH